MSNYRQWYHPKPQDYRRGNNDEITTPTGFFQHGLRSTKKLKSNEDNSQSSKPSQHRCISNQDEKKPKSARRDANRLAAQRFRNRQKTIINDQDDTIRELQRDKTSLQATNNALREQVEEASRQFCQLRHFVDQVQVTLEWNLLQHRIGQQEQDALGRVPSRASRALVQAAGLPNTPLIGATTDHSQLLAQYEQERAFGRNNAD